MDSQTGWYLVFTKPQQEKIAKINLEHQGFRIYLPLIKQYKRQKNLYQIVIEPLFRRYLFIFLKQNIDDWSKIRSTRGCLSLVRFGALPARLPDKLIEQLQHDEEIRLTDPDEKTCLFKPGDKVEIIDGLLKGYEGIFNTTHNQDRVSILLNIAETYSCSISLPIHQISKIN